MKILYLTSFLLGIMHICCAQQFCKYVDPFIGTSNFGTTNPGAIVPQGMASVVPFNVTGSNLNKWDKDSRWWSTPYSAENTFLTGFSHVNLSGVGCPELGVVIAMPTTGEVDASIKRYGSLMSQQKATPGYYSCFIDKYNILAEATSTERTGLSRYTFPKGKGNILIDLGNGLTNESGGSIRVVNSQEVEGWRTTGNFCYHNSAERTVYFVARLDKKPDECGVWKRMPKMDGVEAEWASYSDQFNYYPNSMQPMAGDSIGAFFTFNCEANEKVNLQVGISYVSIENARLNLDAEQNGLYFDDIRKQAEQKWEDKLSVISVEGGSESQKKVFYTALYHLHIHPNIINDINGEYPAMEGDYILSHKSRNRYTIFSLWDTYRTYHPLMTLLYPDLQLDFVHSMIDMYNECGWLPKWELNSRETYTMNGDPSLPVIADTYLKGIDHFDIETAYNAMMKHIEMPDSSNKIRFENDFYLEHGYVPFRYDFDHSVSDALELYLADWTAGQLALKLGKKKDYKKLDEQSKKYKLYFDKEGTKTLRPKNVDGSFLANFDPFQGKDFEPVHGFHEGTSWQYTFAVPHDVEGLIQLFGGNRDFTSSLQKVFDDDLFDMGNEPDIHYPYLFNYIKGEEWRAQKTVKTLLNEHFHDGTGGLPGNDDCGTMSGWAVWSMIGLYPVCPGDLNYAVVEPVFDRIIIKLDSNYYPNEALEITKEIKSKGSISGIYLNQKRNKNFFVDHNAVVSEGKIKIIIGSEQKGK